MIHALKHRFRYVNKWGKGMADSNSFSIYLLHMPIAGIVANVLNRSEWFALITIWRPFIVIVLTMVLILVYKKFVKDRSDLLLLVGTRNG